MNEVIRICNLHKSFKDVHAVNDLSFKVNEGELFAFLGVNGAGKSTLLRLMSGVYTPKKGKIENKQLYFMR